MSIWQLVKLKHLSLTEWMGWQEWGVVSLWSSHIMRVFDTYNRSLKTKQNKPIMLAVPKTASRHPKVPKSHRAAVGYFRCSGKTQTNLTYQTLANYKFDVVHKCNISCYIPFDEISLWSQVFGSSYD